MHHASMQLALMPQPPQPVSPIEEMFWARALQSPILATWLQRQVQVGRFSLDFGDPTTRRGIELDGWEWHGNKARHLKDIRRDRELALEHNWSVLHFLGLEVHRDLERVIRQCETFIDHDGRRTEHRRWYQRATEDEVA